MTIHIVPSTAAVADQIRDELYSLYERAIDAPPAEQDALDQKIARRIQLWERLTTKRWPPDDFLKRPVVRSPSPSPASSPPASAPAPALTWPERIANYEADTGYPPAFWTGEDGRLAGLWILGNDYRVASEYYGGYPATYLKRIASLFPDKRRALHVFSGRVDVTILPGDTVDSNPTLSPTFIDDVQTLANVPLESYDLILCDPPYSVEDAEHYGTSMVKRNKVLDVLGRRLTAGTHVVWLDQVLPMYRKTDFDVEARIGIVKSTNHRFRVVTIFRKVAAP